MKKSKKYINEVFASVEKQKSIVGPNLSFAAAEAYKLLRTNLIYSMTNEKPCRIVGITSSLKSEGKSTTAINIAYTLAEAQKKVLLIEADMRIPIIGKILDLDLKKGLSNVLAGVSELNDVVSWSCMGQKTLAVLPAGEIPPNPSELLSSNRMKSIIDALESHFDYIIMDLPPVTAVSDSLNVASLIDGMIVVVRQDYCDQYSLNETMRQLEFLKVKVLGFVMNATDKPKKRYKKYGRSYGNGYSYYSTNNK